MDGSISADMAVAASSAMDKQTFGAQVVTKTLDYMNSNQSGGGGSTSTDYDFQKSVLDSAYGASGALVNSKI